MSPCSAVTDCKKLLWSISQNDWSWAPTKHFFYYVCLTAPMMSINANCKKSRTKQNISLAYFLKIKRKERKKTKQNKTRLRKQTNKMFLTLLSSQNINKWKINVYIYIYIYIYIYTVCIQCVYIFTFIRRFYPKRLTVHWGYTFFFCQYMCSLGVEPTTFALLTQCSNHWATGTCRNILYIYTVYVCIYIY